MGKRHKKRFSGLCGWTETTESLKVKEEVCPKKENIPTKVDKVKIKRNSPPKISEVQAILKELGDIEKHIQGAIQQLKIKIGDAIREDFRILSRYLVVHREKIDQKRIAEMSAKEDESAFFSTAYHSCIGYSVKPAPVTPVPFYKTTISDTPAGPIDQANFIEKKDYKNMDIGDAYPSRLSKNRNDLKDVSKLVDESKQQLEGQSTKERYDSGQFKNGMQETIGIFRDETDSNFTVDAGQRSLMHKLLTADTLDVGCFGTGENKTTELFLEEELPDGIQFDRYQIGDNVHAVKRVSVTVDGGKEKGISLHNTELTFDSKHTPTGIKMATSAECSTPFDDHLDQSVHEVSTDNEQHEPDITRGLKSSTMPQCIPNSITTCPGKLEKSCKPNVDVTDVLNENPDPVHRWAPQLSIEYHPKLAIEYHPVSNVTSTDLSHGPTSNHRSTFDELLEQAVREITTENDEFMSKPVLIQHRNDSDVKLSVLSSVPNGMQEQVKTKEAGFEFEAPLPNSESAECKIIKEVLPDTTAAEATKVSKQNDEIKGDDVKADILRKIPVRTLKTLCQAYCLALQATKFTPKTGQDDCSTDMKTKQSKDGDDPTETENTKVLEQETKSISVDPGNEVKKETASGAIAGPSNDKEKGGITDKAEEEMDQRTKLLFEALSFSPTSFDKHRFTPKANAKVSLQDLMDKRCTFQETHAKFACLNLMDVLDFLQSRGVTHTDICPRNVVFNEIGYPCLTGYQKARIRGCNIKVPRSKPKVDYTSPEQIMRGHVTEATDVFSTGVLGFNIVYGRSPHKAATNKQTKQNILNENFVPKFEPDGLLSKPGKRFLVWCIRKDLDKRFNVKTYGASLFESIEWFKDYDVETLRNFTFPSPFKQYLTEEHSD